MRLFPISIPNLSRVEFLKWLADATLRRGDCWRVTATRSRRAATIYLRGSRINQTLFRRGHWSPCLSSHAFSQKRSRGGTDCESRWSDAVLNLSGRPRCRPVALHIEHILRTQCVLDTQQQVLPTSRLTCGDSVGNCEGAAFGQMTFSAQGNQYVDRSTRGTQNGS